MERNLDPTQKAFEINLNQQIYGCFAEIGAGQEVARYFFRAGGAAGTIAKSMSAYDMAISDEIYGKSDRYVAKERLERMLEREYDQLVQRLDQARGKETCFFVFADTVAAKSFKNTSFGHGWLGVRFQHEPKARPSQIVIHVEMRDQINLQQQEALGILGTNLIHSCFNLTESREAFISALMDSLGKERLSIDFIDINGPAFETTDPRLWLLELVKQAYCGAVMFDQQGHACQPKDILYRKNILISRGSYRPPTLFNIDMLEEGHKKFCEVLPKEERENIIILPEISMNKLKERGEVIAEDFLARVDLLGVLGHHALITSYETYGDLNYFLAQCTKKEIGYAMGFYNLQEVFDEKNYAKNFGGILGSLGALLARNTRLFVYPALNEKNNMILSSMEVKRTDNQHLLLKYLREEKLIYDIEDFNQDAFKIWSRVVLRMIQNNEDGWEAMVPEIVAKLVKEKCLFDFPCKI
jgi:hypothetical protein